jgi:Ca2+-binding RTX toxin-like protein
LLAGGAAMGPVCATFLVRQDGGDRRHRQHHGPHHLNDAVGSDTLLGGNGNNLLDGRAGADTWTAAWAMTSL